MYYRVKTKNGKKSSTYIVEDVVIEGVSKVLIENGITDIVRSISDTKYGKYIDLTINEEDTTYYYEVKTREIGENGKPHTYQYLVKACGIEDIRKFFNLEDYGDIKSIVKTDIKSIFQKKQ